MKRPDVTSLPPRRKEYSMLIGERLRWLRVGKNLSQGVIEERTGLLRAYISRVENGHTVPAMETLEKFARALEVPLYVLFYEREESPPVQARVFRQQRRTTKKTAFERRLVRLLAQMDDRSRRILFEAARKMAQGFGWSLNGNWGAGESRLSRAQPRGTPDTR
jgi:transcriptional regulator with XRE-family HTH domain